MLSNQVASADGPTEPDLWMLQEVMPEATEFTARVGDPPVIQAFRTDSETDETDLIGYVFLTSDLPPEKVGYSAPIEVLVGMDLNGVISGIKVLHYQEPMKGIIGDFLNRPGVQEQFTGKSITDRMRVGVDIDGVSRATITVNAMAIGIRNAARRVARAYFVEEQIVQHSIVSAPELPPNLDVSHITGSWEEMLAGGLVQRIAIGSRDSIWLDLAFAFVNDEEFGQRLLGESRYLAARSVSDVGEVGPRFFIVGTGGSNRYLFGPELLTIEQDGEFYPVLRDAFIPVGKPGGVMSANASLAGVLKVNPMLDFDRPATILYDMRPEMGLYSAEYVPKSIDEASPNENLGTASTPVTLSPSSVAASLLFDVDELSDLGDESTLDRLITQAAETRALVLSVLLVMALFAFMRKDRIARWIVLGFSIVFMGFMDGSFLSVSHIIHGIHLGPSLFTSDLSLLLVTGFVIATTLLWGRVFCGFICPFGALQAFMSRLAPRRIRRELPASINDRAQYVKYGLLGLLLVLTLASSDLSIFQYVEPFGTLFYVSSSTLLWVLLVGVLMASAVIPQFYCRYACPLGAALGLASLLTLFRIKRVSQCGVCNLCEQKCPTGAIRSGVIDFKECVRCNVCETLLESRSGTCRHDLEVIRKRLNNWQPATVLE
ncbi:MAG: 4Fe-4S binding protein [Chloroflexi bacterium]|nr:4Fe-4S binding protein [Chloroflexota bacterium]